MLEIAVFNIESAMRAAAAGADRLELCENPGEGGTTPSYGTLKRVKNKLKIPVFPIIRPRGGDFLYTHEEFEVMKLDILLCKEMGFEGVVIGLLLLDGNIDVTRTRQLVELAYPLDVTFHRAFDRCIDPIKGLEDVIETGCTRILTSGQVPNAFDGKELIKKLVEQAGDRIVIMPGSGVRSENIAALATATGARELHSSARSFSDSEMRYSKDSMKEKMQNVFVDSAEIGKMKNALASLAQPENA